MTKRFTIEKFRKTRENNVIYLQIATYIWGENNEPLKVLTEEDYEAAAKRRLENAPDLPPRASTSTFQIVCMVIGIIMIITAFVLRVFREKR